MEELADYLRGESINIILQTYLEEEELINNLQWNSKLNTEEVIQNDLIKLVQTNEGTFILNYEVSPILPGYKILKEWSLHKSNNNNNNNHSHNNNNHNHHNNNNEKGWKYNHIDNPTKRERCWEQLLVQESQYNDAILLLNDFYLKFRAINQSFIRRALEGYEFYFQYVLESQRYLNGMYSPYNLKLNDPPSWSFVPSSEPFSSIDPCNVSISNLIQISPEQFRIPLGWTYLHDFMFTSYPSRDICGWQYSNDFESSQFHSSQINLTSSTTTTSSSSSTTTTKEIYLVRRRLWIRTLVKENDIQNCRYVFEKYIQNHPRGNILSTKIYRQSHYRKRWCFGTALLTDKSLQICLDDNYQQNITYNLKGCEVSVLTLKLQDSQTPINCHIHNQPSRSSYISSLPFLGCHHLPKKWYLFGLKYIINKSDTFHISNGSIPPPKSISPTLTSITSTSNHNNNNQSSNNNNITTTLPSSLPPLPPNSYPTNSTYSQNLNGSMQCILSALTRKERDIWISILFQQLLLVNLHYYPIITEYGLRLGPPLVIDSKYISGKLWKKGDIVWKLRYFELRNNSRLSSYKNGLFLGEVDLKDCHLQIPNDLSFHYPFNILNKSNDIILQLAAESSINRDYWIAALQYHISKLNGIEQYDNINQNNINQNNINNNNNNLISASDWFNTNDILERSNSPVSNNGTESELITPTFVSFSHHKSITKDVNPSSSSSSSLSFLSLFSHNNNNNNNNSNNNLSSLSLQGNIGSGSWIYEPVMNLRMISYEIIQEYNHIESDEDSNDKYDDSKEYEDEVLESISSQESEESTYSLSKLTLKK